MRGFQRSARVNFVAGRLEPRLRGLTDLRSSHTSARFWDQTVVASAREFERDLRKGNIEGGHTLDSAVDYIVGELKSTGGPLGASYVNDALNGAPNDGLTKDAILGHRRILAPPVVMSAADRLAFLYRDGDSPHLPSRENKGLNNTLLEDVAREAAVAWFRTRQHFDHIPSNEGFEGRRLPRDIPSGFPDPFGFSNPIREGRAGAVLDDLEAKLAAEREAKEKAALEEFCQKKDELDGRVRAMLGDEDLGLLYNTSPFGPQASTKHMHVDKSPVASFPLQFLPVRSALTMLFIALMRQYGPIIRGIQRQRRTGDEQALQKSLPYFLEQSQKLDGTGWWQWMSSNPLAQGLLEDDLEAIASLHAALIGWLSVEGLRTCGPTERLQRGREFVDMLVATRLTSSEFASEMFDFLGRFVRCDLNFHIMSLPKPWSQFKFEGSSVEIQTRNDARREGERTAAVETVESRFGWPVPMALRYMLQQNEIPGQTCQALDSLATLIEEIYAVWEKLQSDQETSSDRLRDALLRLPDTSEEVREALDMVEDMSVSFDSRYFHRHAYDVAVAPRSMMLFAHSHPLGFLGNNVWHFRTTFEFGPKSEAPLSTLHRVVAARSD